MGATAGALRVPVTAFAPGSTHPFAWYFEGESTVRVASLDEVCQWLRGCAYVSDQEQFGEPDVWQHPCDFERARKGDCEDHALWAWRKLVGLGMDAELVCGWILRPASHSADVDRSVTGLRDC